MANEIRGPSVKVSRRLSLNVVDPKHGAARTRRNIKFGKPPHERLDDLHAHALALVDVEAGRQAAPFIQNLQAPTVRCLPEVHRTITVPANATFWRKCLAFAGPGFLVAVAQWIGERR